MMIKKIGRYEIETEIGIGGMGRVYRAIDPDNEHQVAIKMLPPEYLNDLGFRSRFEEESQLVAALDHPAIVPVYEFGEWDGQPYLVMAYLSHGSLADRLTHGPLAVEKVEQIFERIASALDYAHQKGIVHLDLKASNILFDDEEQTYLADFGIALQTENAWQQNMAISGTPAYMSPEQALHESRIDWRTDIYSLGVIVYEMLTASLPFEGDIPMAILFKHIHATPPRLSDVRGDLPAVVDMILQRALAKDPIERFSSAGEFYNQFCSAIQDPASESCPDVALFEEVLDPISSEGRNKDIPAPDADYHRVEIYSDKPKFPPISLPQRSRVQRVLINQWGGRFALAIGLVTWLGVLIGAASVALAKGPALLPAANLQIVYNSSVVAIVNLSEIPVDLTGLTFERLSDPSTVLASFSSQTWARINPKAVRELPQGGCFQLLRANVKDIQLEPGESPAKPSSCEASQGWVVAADQSEHFWISGDEQASFEVRREDQEIHRCKISAGYCQFHLPSRLKNNGD
jgi:serine/threonine protein kinase